ncbi:MAG: exosortase [Pseudomonadales bacterium]|jgi:exosortase A
MRDSTSSVRDLSLETTGIERIPVRPSRLPRPLRSRQTLVLTVLACASVAVVYWSSLVSLVSVWSTQNHRHGFLVAGAAAWLLWRNRDQYPEDTNPGSWWGVLLLSLCVWGWIVARISLVGSLEHLTLLLSFGAATLAVVGWQSFRAMTFPFFFLLLAFPVGDSLIPALMASTADIAEGLARAVDLPLYRHGSVMVLPGGTFEIADVCAGFSQLSTGVIIGTLFAYLTFRKVVNRILFVLAMTGVLVVENGVRAFLIMAIASASNMKYLGGSDHITFGWILFGLTLFAMLWAGRHAAGREH